MFYDGDVYYYRAAVIGFTSLDYGWYQLFWTDGRDNRYGNWWHGELYVNGNWSQPSINSRVSFSYIYRSNIGYVYVNGNGFEGMYGSTGGGINPAKFINANRNPESGYFVQWWYGLCNVNAKWRYAVVYIFWVIDLGLSSRHVQLHGNGCGRMYGEHYDNDHSTFGLGGNGNINDTDIM